MYELREYAVTKVSSTSVDMNVDADTVLYTVPTGKTFIPTLVVIRDLSATMANTVLTLGSSTDNTDFRTAMTCSGASATTKVLLVYPNYAATPAAGSGLMTEITAGNTFILDITTVAGGACTATVDLFGYLY